MTSAPVPVAGTATSLSALNQGLQHYQRDQVHGSLLTTDELTRLSDELLRTPVPARFAGWAAQPAELHRSLTQWYPRFEQQALQAR